ncbi:MAG: MBL fold metallo-hydrolase [Candidatus Hatepunaea meridiana]|nr:MBL fold metallo-hydrolase [Candidatus Hatepunaea meridiana]
MKQELSKIVLLGTGTPNADPERFGPSVAIIVNETPYIIDFGPGVVRRAAAAYQAGITGLDVRKLCTAFVTHLHSDHTSGYPDIILTPWVLGREEPLEVYGPPGIRAMTEHIMSAYKADMNERLDGLEPANDSGYQVNVFEIDSGIVYRDQNVEVEAFAVDHGSLPSFGYKFHTPDRTIVISGDTKPKESLIKIYQDCDILIHEVYSSVGFEKRSPAWKKYHSSVHTSSTELAEIATKVKPGLLILYHQLFHGVSEENLLTEVREGYHGNVVSGKDLDIY